MITPGASRRRRTITPIRPGGDEAARITLAVYNVLFHPVPRLVSGEAPVGVHSVTWDGLDQGGLNVPSGVYLYLLTADTGLRDVRKMLLVR